MGGYFTHYAGCGKEALRNRSFVLGVEAPDILKKHVKVYGIEGARAKYESLRTNDMPEYQELEERIRQKERHGSTDGLHYGVSSSPNVKACWNGLSEQQKNNPFYRGYVWHLLEDAIIYGRQKIDNKFQKFLDENKDSPNIEELKNEERNKLHLDWDKTNSRIRETYPEIFLTEEVKELDAVKFFDEGELTYIEWPVLKESIDYMRTFDPLNGDMEAIIEEIMNNI